MACELTTYSSYDSNVTLLDMYVNAAKYMYGDDIGVVLAPWVYKQLNDISFAIAVEASDQQITEKTKTTVDITTKEYTNCSQEEVDETVMKVKKNCFTSKENKYQFLTTNGVNWGMGGNIGAKVMGLSMSGGSTTVGGYYNHYKEDKQAFHADFNYGYEQKEKISVPPMSYVKATITSYVIKYEQGYTLRFSIPSNYRLTVMYKTCYNKCCCGTNTGYVTAAQMFHTLPNYREQHNTSSFTQDGILTWMGEGSNVHKEVKSLLQARSSNTHNSCAAATGKTDLTGSQKTDLTLVQPSTETK